MPSESSTSPAVGRALDMLTYLAQRTGTVPASTIARDLDLPRSSVYHILTVLTERGFTVYVPEARVMRWERRPTSCRPHSPCTTNWSGWPVRCCARWPRRPASRCTWAFCAARARCTC